MDPETSADDLSTLQRIALNATGSHRRPADKWAKSPDELAGTGPQITQMLERVPTGRLVILGEPGAGKTVLMIRLVLDLLSARQSDEPVPVLCPVASWNPVSTRLHDWLAGMLIMDHPFLAAQAPPGVHRTNCAQALLSNGRIMPILDGLDEIPDDVRSHAIAGINTALSSGGQTGVFEFNRGGAFAWLLLVLCWWSRLMGAGCRGCRRCGRGGAGLRGCGSRRRGGPRVWRGG